MLALVLVAVSVGLSNLAASVGIGAGGVTLATRLLVVVTFGIFEAGMPIVGLLIGHGMAGAIGREARWIAAVLLTGIGLYGIIAATLRNRGRLASQESARPSWLKISVSAFALSLDNLIAGFALGSYQVNLASGALVFGMVAIALSLIGLEAGARLGKGAGESGEIIGGVVLAGVGVAVGFGLLG